MALMPWYKVAIPRVDLREGKPVDASEFAIQLDQVINGSAPADYREPSRLFSKTYLTSGLIDLISEVERRLFGETINASPVITLSTQFGGGKTHALTLLYHLARLGPKARGLLGINDIISTSKIEDIPESHVAVFVGTDFDYLIGKGANGEPVRKTPWGEIAWQLGGAEGLKYLADHEEKKTAPGKEPIRKILPKNKPVLILMDEVLNFMSRARTQKVGDSTLASQFYDFLHNLSEVASSTAGVCMVLSLPRSEREMTPEDEVDLSRLQKMTTRVGKSYVLSEGLEIAEIIRRRLFEDFGSEKDRKNIAKSYSDFLISNREKLPKWFPVDKAEEIFEATYPFHPTSLSVFERKWQALPQFQRTRGVLRMFALWVSNAYREGFRNAHNELLISLGSAPFEDSFFRAEIFDELGKNLEEALMSDIAGEEAHATALDRQSSDTIKRIRLHRKVAATIFFESSGGQVKEFATEPEIRLAVSQPGIDIANIETVLDALTTECYFLTGDGKRYWISTSPSLNKLLADRRANISDLKIREVVDDAVRKVFSSGSRVSIIFFPENSSQLPNTPSLTFVVPRPDHIYADNNKIINQNLLDSMTKEYGTSARTFKSALIWIVADRSNSLNDEARNLLAWKSLEDESESLRLNDSQRKYLKDQINRSERDLKEAVWRSYRNVRLLGKDYNWKPVNFGLVHSSAAENITKLVLNRLIREGDIEENVGPNYLVRNWPPALSEWSTKSLQEIFFASPQFPRLVEPESLKRTIVEGVKDSIFGYTSKSSDGSYSDIVFGAQIAENDVEISDDVFIIPRDLVLNLRKGNQSILASSQTPTQESQEPATLDIYPADKGLTIEKFPKLVWEGDIPPQKWMHFYTKVLSTFGIGSDIKIHLKVEIQPQSGIPHSKVEETKLALKDLGLPEGLSIDDK